MAEDGAAITPTALPEEICKETIAEWNDAASDYVRAKMFDRKQFVTDADLETGGRIQKLVTTDLHINGAERQRRFWEDHGGRATVRKTVRQKRQTAQNAMKLAFRGEFVYCCVTAVLGRIIVFHYSSTNNILCIVPLLTAPVIEWITRTTKENAPDPPKPEVFLEGGGLRGNVPRYTEFADKMVCAVNGKSRYNPRSGRTLFHDLVPPSQEAFALLLYKNGYENWVWMHTHACMTSDGSNITVEDEGDDEECPAYKYTRRRGDLTSRNGGWSSDGMTLYNELYKKVKEDRQNDNGAFGKIYREHRAHLLGKKRKRRCTNGQDPLTVSDDLDELWAAAAVTTGNMASV